MPSAAQPTDGMSDGGSTNLSDHPDVIDMIVFEQILEMDDDPDDREFSKEIVTGFFEQAENTFEEMDTALASEDLTNLSQLGHFLKGSSATLGLQKVQKSCEKIQNYGKGLDATGNKPEPDRQKSLKSCSESITAAKKEYHEAQDLLKQYFHLD